MVLHGTFDQPEYIKNGPRKYLEPTEESSDEQEAETSGKKIETVNNFKI